MVQANDLRLRLAMERPEWVSLLVRYRAGCRHKAAVSVRIISPAYLEGETVVALDLGREDYRAFRLAGLTILGMVASWSIVPPTPCFEGVCE